MEPYWLDLGAELLHAAAHGEVEHITSLLAAGTSVDSKGWLRNRPLHIACARGQLAAASLLLQSGARVGATNAAKATPLHEAAVHGECICAEQCVLFGADVNAVDRFGSTPLHAAARHGHLEMVRLLIAAGSDHTAKDELGMTSRQLAKQQAKVFRSAPGASRKDAATACTEIVRVLAEENLETVVATMLLRALQRLAWGAAMHARLGGRSVAGSRSVPELWDGPAPRPAVVGSGSAAYALPYELACSIASLLPTGGDYPLVRRHRQEQRGRWRVRSLAAGVLQSLVPRDPDPAASSSRRPSRAAKVKVRTPRGGASADAGVAAAQRRWGNSAAMDSGKAPRHGSKQKGVRRRKESDPGISITEMQAAQASAVAAMAAGEVNVARGQRTRRLRSQQPVIVSAALDGEYEDYSLE